MAITSTAPKVANLILNLDVSVKSLAVNVPKGAYSVDTRRDTGGSFNRGIE